MSIKVLGKDYFSCSHYKKNVFVLEWRPEKMLSAGTEVSLRLGTKKQFLSLDVRSSSRLEDGNIIKNLGTEVCLFINGIPCSSSSLNN